MQLIKLLELERLFKEQVRIVRRAEKAQDHIRFKIYSCQNRHEEAVSDFPEQSFGVLYNLLDWKLNWISSLRST